MENCNCIFLILFKQPDSYGNIVYNYVDMKYADFRETVLDLRLQKTITRDNVEIMIQPLLRYKINNAVRLAYETSDVINSVQKLVQTSLRSIVGEMGLDDTLASREEIQRLMLNKISNICNNWGITVIGLELLEINTTYDIQESMHQQIISERVRRTTKVKAEGEAEKMKLEEEGKCTARKTIATGEAEREKIIAQAQSQAKLAVAESEAKSITIMKETLQEFDINPAQYLIAIKYLETLQEIVIKASSRKIYLPLETDVVGALNEIN